MRVVVCDERSLSSELRLEDGAIVDTRPSENVVAYGSSDRVTVMTSPLVSVAKKRAGSREARLESDEAEASVDCMLSAVIVSLCH